MKMRFSPIPAEGNFRLPGSRPTVNGLKIDVLLNYIGESSPDQLETRKTWWKRIKSMDMLARTIKEEELREKVRVELKQLVMNCLNNTERRQAMDYSTLVHTYPYVSKGAKNGSIEWIGESTIRSAAVIREIKKTNRKGLKMLE